MIQLHVFLLSNEFRCTGTHSPGNSYSYTFIPCYHVTKGLKIVEPSNWPGHLAHYLFINLIVPETRTKSTCRHSDSMLRAFSSWISCTTRKLRTSSRPSPRTQDSACFAGGLFLPTTQPSVSGRFNLVITCAQKGFYTVNATRCQLHISAIFAAYCT